MLSKLDTLAPKSYFFSFVFKARFWFANQNQKRLLLSKDFFQLINQFSWVDSKFNALEAKMQHWRMGNKCLCTSDERECYCPDHKFWYFVLITSFDKRQFNCCLLLMVKNTLPRLSHEHSEAVCPYVCV